MDYHMISPYKYLITILFLSISIGAFCQTTFSITFENSNNEYLLDIAADNFGNFYGVGYQTYKNSTIKKPIIWKVDSNIDTTSKVFEFNDSIAMFTQVYINEEGTLYVFGSIRPNDFAEQSILFLKLGPSFNIIEKKITKLPNIELFNLNNVLLSDNAIWVFGNYGNYLGIKKPGVFLFDSNMNLNSFRLYSYDEEGNFSDAFFSLDSTKIYSFVKDFNNSPIANYNPYDLFIIDKELNELAIFPLPTHQISDYCFYSGDVSGGFINNNLVICGSIDHGNVYNNSLDIGFTVTNLDLEVLNFSVFGKPNDTIDIAGYIRSCYILSHDRILITGTCNLGNSFYPSTPSIIYVALINNLAEIQYERLYGGDAHYWTTKIISTPDGGILIGALKYQIGSTWQRDIYMLKLDNQGLMTNVIEKRAGNFKPYKITNINNGKVIEIFVNSKSGSFKLYDLNGKFCYGGSLVEGYNNITLRSKGIYIICIDIDKNTYLEKIIKS